jgi:hypothetical protein
VKTTYRLQDGKLDHAAQKVTTLSERAMADGVRTSLPENRETAPAAGLKRQNPAAKDRLAAAETIRRPSRRSRSR